MIIKKWLLHGFVVVAAPCAVLFIAEMIFRLFDIGYDPRFFLQEKKRGKVYCIDNPAFGRRFFPPTLVRTSEKLKFPMIKGAGDRRIFIIGSSAAQGEPAPAFSFSRILNCMMQDRYGSTHCEVINTAMTAINSHVVVPIARECSGLSPDIFIVYMGNNEVIGPFGPGTVFSRFSSLALIRLKIFISSTRLGQCAFAVSQSIGKHTGVPVGWGGMKMFLGHTFRFDDPKLTGVYQNYRENLRAICTIARQSGARVVLCSVASNSKDCGPFFSMHCPRLSADNLQQWEAAYRRAIDLQSQGRFAPALTLLEKAAEIDDTYADLRFRMGQCLANLDRFDEARLHFIAARDYDALRFRADSRINTIVKDVALEFAGNAVFYNAQERLCAASAQGVCGEEQFLEHVHFNIHGNYLLAAGLLPLMDSLISAPIASPRAISEAACKERLAFTPWEELRIDQAICDRLTKAPFKSREDNLSRAAALQREIHRLTALAADSGRSVFALYQRAVSLEPNDWRIRELLGNFLLENKYSVDSAQRAFRMVLDSMPHDEFACNGLAIALEQQGKTAEALDYYQEAIRINPLFFEPSINSADNLLHASRLDEAERRLKAVLKINPELPSALQRYALIMLFRGKAVSDPNWFKQNAIFRIALAAFYTSEGLRLEKEGNIGGAIKKFEASIDVCPESIEAQNNLKRLRAP